MYKFELFDVNSVDVAEYEHYEHKNLFTTIPWLKYLREWKNVEPIIVRITTECDGSLVGHFTGCLFKKFGFKILGSPFYGWMGQHMGFDFENPKTINKSVVLDEVICYLRQHKVMSFLIFADFQYTEQDVELCKTKLFHTDIRGSYFLDLTQSEEQIFKNFKSGYRTCVRKFEKLGGTIVEDWSDSFMEEHHAQLAEVFERKNMTPPNYRSRLYLLHEMNPEIILPIKALDENGNNIASSFYFYGGGLAFFQSNASYTKALSYNANQALMWYAIRYFKSKGVKTLDMAGRAAYKENFGPILKNTPTTVWTKYVVLWRAISFARKLYYASFRIKYRIGKLFKRK